MRILAALIVAISAFGQAHADSIRFECRPINPPLVQGEERWVRFEFRADGATLEIASMESPYVSPLAGLELRSSAYSDTSSSASAIWRSPGGADVIVASFAYFGSWWGGRIFFAAPVVTPRLSFSDHEEIELRCFER